MGIEEDLKHEQPCHPRACAIQACLQRNSYDENKCQKLIDALYDCCNLFYERNGETARTPTCPKPSLLRLKVQQRSQDQ